MKSEVQNNTRKYDFTKHIFIQFSPCTGPLINKINNVNILRNLHLFREYTQQFTATTKPFAQGETHILPLSQTKRICLLVPHAPKTLSQCHVALHCKRCYWLKSGSIEQLFSDKEAFQGQVHAIVLCV
jgi:hypothetical protein